MIVHFIGSAQNIVEDMPYFRGIIDAIHENGGSIARNWVDVAYQRHVVHKVPDDEVDWRPVMEAKAVSLELADVMIVEVSGYTFSQGFQVAGALQRDKPVLLLTRVAFKARTFSGYQSDLLTIEEYQTAEEAAHIVGTYLSALKAAIGSRQIAITESSRLRNYLQSAQANQELSEEELLQDLIEAGLRFKAIVHNESRQ